ncbi:MAG: hypothetical protein LBT98_04325 [Puniceicoccales bacterium]|nr:hypothetical protein [Puniceicoccales bacterium]
MPKFWLCWGLEFEDWGNPWLEEWKFWSEPKEPMPGNGERDVDTAEFWKLAEKLAEGGAEKEFC